MQLKFTSGEGGQQSGCLQARQYQKVPAVHRDEEVLHRMTR